MSIKSKIAQIDLRKRQKIIGVAIILIGLTFMGLFFRSCESQNDNEYISKEQTEETTVGNGFEDISSEDAAAQMNLQIEIPQKIKERIPDTNVLQRELQNYLIAEDFWADTTRATSDYTITEDFNQNTIKLGFVLNDSAQTNVTVLIDKDDGTYTFNYF